MMGADDGTEHRPGMIDDLYSARILALAANMPHAGRLPDAPHGAGQASVEKVSRLCGSTVIVDVAVRQGRVVAFAQEVRACALGQAAAAILGEQAVGAGVEEIAAGRDALKAMLKTGAPPPAGRFAALAVLAQVKDFPARHASTSAGVRGGGRSGGPRGRSRAPPGRSDAAPQPAQVGAPCAGMIASDPSHGEDGAAREPSLPVVDPRVAQRLQGRGLAVAGQPLPLHADLFGIRGGGAGLPRPLAGRRPGVAARLPLPSLRRPGLRPAAGSRGQARTGAPEM